VLSHKEADRTLLHSLSILLFVFVKLWGQGKWLTHP